MTACQWVHQVDPGQEATWGSEATAMAAVARTGVPVLPGFVVSREAVLAFFLQPAVRAGILKACKNLSVRKVEQFPAAAHEVRDVIMTASLPAPVKAAMAAYLEELEDQLVLTKGQGLPLTLTCDELAHHGTPKSFVEAEKLLKQLFTQSFTEQALHARYMAEEAIVPTFGAVIFRYAPASELAGTSQQYDPENHDGSVIYVRVAHHEAPDHTSPADTYRLDARSLVLLSKAEGSHHWAAKKRGAHVSPKHAHSTHTLPERQLRLLARFTRRSQEAFQGVQRFSWQLFMDSVVITRVEPIVDGATAQAPTEKTGREPLVVGHGVHLGTATGPLRLIKAKADWDGIQDGDVIVLEHLSSKDVTKLAGTAALITETGHHTAPEAAAAKQLGIPAVTAISNALRLLRQGQLVTVDGTHGAVYAGTLPASELKPHQLTSELPITGTKILAAVDDALLVTPAFLQNVDGVGMLRGEFILRLLGVHPQEILHQGMAEEYVDLLAEGIEKVVRAAGHKSVTYQLHDISEHSFHGWKQWRRSSHEPNQLIGNRGTHRLLSEPELLQLEVRALERVVAKGAENLELLLPMVRSLDELKRMRRLLQSLAPDSLSEHIAVRVETPALTIQAEQLALLQPASVVFDVPALATLITGMDASNHQVGHHRDQSAEAVLEALSYAIATCREHGVATTVLSEQESIRAEVVETAIRAGVTGICVRPEDGEWVHQLVASVEQRLLLEHVVGEA